MKVLEYIRIPTVSKIAPGIKNKTTIKINVPVFIFSVRATKRIKKNSNKNVEKTINRAESTFFICVMEPPMPESL
ncbi:hypothetical protein D3C81_1902440 [compost metagenome]